jgi:hypothetical protein
MSEIGTNKVKKNTTIPKTNKSRPHPRVDYYRDPGTVHARDHGTVVKR